MTKRILALLLSLALLCSLLPPVRAEAADAPRSGQCGDQLTWTLDDEGTLTISGTGDMWNYIPFDTISEGLFFDITESDYTGDPAPWKDSCANVKNLVIEPGVTSIGYYAFWSLTNLTKVELPEGMHTVNYAAFSFCTKLRSVTFPSTLRKLDICFEYSEKIDEVRFLGPVPRSSGMVLMYAAPGLQIYYHSSQGSWDWVQQSWYLPEGTVWYDMDAGLAPGDFAFTQTDYNLVAGSSVQLTTNADSYVQTILTDWVSDQPDIAIVTDNGIVTGLRPGTATITVRSADGTYSASCRVTVQDTPAPDTAIAPLSGIVAGIPQENNYDMWDHTRTAFLTETADGTLEAIQYSDHNVIVARYNQNLEPVSQLTIAPELPLFGGFFAGETYHFLLYGQTNQEESNDKEVLRIVRYTKDWQRLDHCSIYGVNTTVPFDGGTADFAESGGKLYLHTCHEMYTTSDGKNHQANMTFVLDQQTMSVVDQWYDVMNITLGYVSHSFSQRIRASDSAVFRADHGDAHPRSVVLTCAPVDGYITDVSYLALLPIQGMEGSNYTGVSLGGLELSSGNCLVVGNSVDQSDPAAYSPFGTRNIFLCVADQGLRSSKTIWLTDYTPEDQVYVQTPQLVQVTEEVFLVLWMELHGKKVCRTAMLLVDSQGNPLCEALLTDCPLTNCQPIVTDEGLVCWYSACGEDRGYLYQLNWRQLLTDRAAVEAALGHNYTTQIVEPTCLDQGYTVYSCSICHTNYYDNYTDPLGHAFGEWHTILEPTHDAPGQEQRSCSRCGETETRTLAGDGHHYTVTVVAATCTEPGYTSHSCECGDSYTTDHVEPLGHAWLEQWNSHKSPTCTEPGEEWQYCQRCNAYNTREIPPSGHDLGEWYVHIEATCASEGEERLSCWRCDYYETRPIPRTDHSHTAVITEPTCTEGGYTTYTCRCGDSYTVNETEALGHDFDPWHTISTPTCTEMGAERRSCQRCGYMETCHIPATGHDLSATVTAPDCTTGGYTTYTCTVCGYTEIGDHTPAEGHDFSPWDLLSAPTCTEAGQEERKCNRCLTEERREISAAGHSYVITVVEPDCTRGGYTLYRCHCGDSYENDHTDALGHDWKDGHCSRCGSVQQSPFTDVTERDYFFGSVLWAVDQGITAGTSATTFSPDEPCTRAQVVTFLWRAMGKPETREQENPFHDVPADAYYYDAVLWAVENGITSGTGAGRFSPEEPCTRAQVVTFLWRSMGKEEPMEQNTPFIDVSGSDYYHIPVLWAVERSITAGTGAGRFSPEEPCTRAQVVTFLYRAMAE